uniref:C2 domain-containing protein n=2 Tax=Physcomitrium patens TaxID=3218 RepID=A0A2K1IRG2_PHYPA|nr:hypothetical protein PHYPA_025989 [Physcomitrium patens]
MTEVHIKVLAAESLKRDGLFTKMSVYSLLWIDPAMKQATRVHQKGGRSPHWNDELIFGRGSTNIPTFYHHHSEIVIKYRRGNHGKLLGTTYLPLVEIARIKALKDDPQEYDTVKLQLTTPSGHVQGCIGLSISLTARVPVGTTRSAEPVMGYPVGLPPDMAYYNTFQFQSAPYEVHQRLSNAGNSRSSRSGLDFPVPARPAARILEYPRRQEESSQSARTPQPYSLSLDQTPSRHRHGNTALALIGGAIGGILVGDFVF